ncbi:MAG: phosphate acyltransferase [Deltaproteobacteria bacterium]|nr:phosphate acyltransferase [Deltaproteobacteria bacterium]
MLNSFKEILAAAKQNGVKKLVVPCPVAADLPLLAEAAAAGLIIPILVGDGSSLELLVNGSPLAAEKYEIVDENDPQQALGRALALVRNGEADILMQGGGAPQELLDAIRDKEQGLLPKGRIISFISIFQLLKREKLILVTDAFINNNPTLVEKQQILENALQLARILGIEAPKVAVLAAIEQVNPGIPSTLDAAILSKMGERRQFGKAIVEGPLDIDCALSQVAAGRKGLQSIVTGNVDIYLVPEIDTGLLLAEALVFFGKMHTAGLVMGTSKPVILNLPFVSDENRVVEIALACLACLKGGTNG